MVSMSGFLNQGLNAGGCNDAMQYLPPYNDDEQYFNVEPMQMQM
jgi:hypothetical protein